MKQTFSLLLGVLLALAIATCGGDDEKTTEEGQSAGTATETVTVRETEHKLDPANPEIKQAGSVEFRVENAGNTVHALEIEGPGEESKTGDIQPGESATVTANLDRPGTYEWYCPVDNHRDLGMEGTIKVGGESGQAGGAGTTETETTETNTTETDTTETDTTETDSGGSGSGSGSSGGSSGY